MKIQDIIADPGVILVFRNVGAILSIKASETVGVGNTVVVDDENVGSPIDSSKLRVGDRMGCALQRISSGNAGWICIYGKPNEILETLER